MDLRTIVMYFMVLFCGSLVLFICYFGPLFTKMQRLILDDSTDTEDMKIRARFIRTTIATFVIGMTMLFTEVIVLTIIAAFNR